MSTAGGRPRTAHLNTLQRNALVVGGMVLILCTLYGVWRPASFFRAYLVGFEFWLAVSLGCLAVMMIRHLTGGGWGLYLRPILEAAAVLAPLMAVLFLPLLLGLDYVYPWRPHFIGSLFARLTPIKVWWFGVPLFVGRAAIYFVAWSALAFLLNMGRRAPDVPANAEPTRLFRVISAPAWPSTASPSPSPHWIGRCR